MGDRVLVMQGLRKGCAQKALQGVNAMHANATKLKGSSLAFYTVVFIQANPVVYSL